MRILVTIPTLSRADLLVRNRAFLESVAAPDEVLILDNGNQKIDLKVPIERRPENLGVPASWNFFLRRAFVEQKFDGLVLLQDDIIWDAGRLAAAKRLLVDRPDVDLLLSDLQFSVQVQRPGNIETIGFYDERFSPAYCEDDDYAIQMIHVGRIYERFPELNPLPGSINEGTPKPVKWDVQYRKLVDKWGKNTLGINIPWAPWYRTNRNFRFPT